MQVRISKDNAKQIKKLAKAHKRTPPKEVDLAIADYVQKFPVASK